MFVWTVKLTKNANTDKYKYSGYGNGFDRKGKFSVGNEFDKNCIILGLDMRSSRKGGTKVIRFKAKDSEINANPLCLEYFCKDVSTGNMKKTGLSGYVYDFCVDYDAIAVDDMLGSQKYLMKKNGIV